MKEPQVHVFVLKSGAVEMKTLDGTHNTYRVPRPPPPLTVRTDDAPAPLTIPYDEYRHRGQMFSGRPILCASGYDVKEATMSLVVSDLPKNVEGADDNLRREIQKLIDRDYVVAPPVLDEWFGDDPWMSDDQRDELRSLHLRHRRRRVLLVVPESARTIHVVDPQDRIVEGQPPREKGI